MKWFRKQRLTAQLAEVLLISFIVLLIAFIGLLLGARTQLRVQEDAYVESLVVQLNQNVQQNYTSLRKIGRLISYNRDVQEFLLTGEETERIVNFARIKSLLSDVSILNASIQDIVIVDQKNNRYSLSDNIVYPLPDLKLTESEMAISGLQEYKYLKEPVFYLVAAQNIYSIDSYLQTNSQIGTLYFILAQEAITGGKYTVNTADSVRIQLTDASGHILWSSGGDEEGGTCDTYHQEGIRETAVSDYSIKIYRRAPVLGAALKEWIGRVYVLYLGFLIFLVLLWGIWVHNVIKPMRELSQFAGQMGDSGLDSLEKRIQLDGYQEISTVSSRINSMLEKILHLTEMVVEKNKELYQSQVYAKQAEISYLRSQINPHFLYNTLETMCGIAYSENQPHLAEIAKALSLIFKYSIKGKDVVPLKDELKIVKSYILIQGVRFPSRFNTQYEIDEGCLSKMVPKMILQPLIENAITHGVEEQEELCHLTVRVVRKHDLLQIQIMDDGVGIGQETLRWIQEQLKDGGQLNREQTNSHIGISNVHNRIRLLYGEPFGISVESRCMKGTSVTVMLPLMDGYAEQ